MQHSFGTYLREKRNEEQLTLRTVAKKLDITATYLSDIEKGHKNPPDRNPDMMSQFQSILHLTDEDMTTLYDLAAKDRPSGQQVPVDLSEYLREQSGIRDFVRTVRKKGLSEENWNELTKTLGKLSNDKAGKVYQDGHSNEPISFGDYLQQKRKERHLSLRYTAQETGISAPYLSDVEKGYKNPLADDQKLKALARALELSESETYTLYDLSASNYVQNSEKLKASPQGITAECPADLRQYLSNNPAVRTFIRAAGTKNLSKAQWQELTKTIPQEHKLGRDAKEKAPKRHYIKRRPSTSKDKDRGRS